MREGLCSLNLLSSLLAASKIFCTLSKELVIESGARICALDRQQYTSASGAVSIPLSLAVH